MAVALKKTAPLAGGYTLGMVHVEEGNLQALQGYLETAFQERAAPDVLEAPNDSGYTMLALAVKRRDYLIAEHLLKTGASPNTPNNVSINYLTNLLSSEQLIAGKTESRKSNVGFAVPGLTVPLVLVGPPTHINSLSISF